MSLTQFNTPEHALDWLTYQGVAASVDLMSRLVRLNSMIREQRAYDIDQAALRVIQNAGWTVSRPRAPRVGGFRFANMDPPIGQMMAPAPEPIQWAYAAPANEVAAPVEPVRGYRGVVMMDEMPVTHYSTSSVVINPDGTASASIEIDVNDLGRLDYEVA